MDDDNIETVEAEMVVCSLCKSTANLTNLQLGDGKSIWVCPQCADIGIMGGKVLSKVGSLLFRRLGVKIGM